MIPEIGFPLTLSHGNNSFKKYSEFTMDERMDPDSPKIFISSNEYSYPQPDNKLFRAELGCWTLLCAVDWLPITFQIRKLESYLAICNELSLLTKKTRQLSRISHSITCRVVQGKCSKFGCRETQIWEAVRSSC